MVTNERSNAMTDEQMIAALQKTWDVIANDIAQCGGSLTMIQAAEVCADYVYMYVGEAESKAIMALDDKAFKRIARKARLSL
jgi:hypothetical protein